MFKTYSEMIKLETFRERFEYLNLHGVIGESVFGFSRFVNQNFYASKQWRALRSQIIIRDNGCDLAIPDRVIFDRIYIHHLNPVNLDQLENNDRMLFDPENLVCVSYETHSAIHYGNFGMLPDVGAERKPGDTTLW